jgi:hypothetical protein
LVGGRKRTLDVFFPAKKLGDAHWEVVPVKEGNFCPSLWYFGVIIRVILRVLVGMCKLGIDVRWLRWIFF